MALLESGQKDRARAIFRKDVERCEQRCGRLRRNHARLSRAIKWLGIECPVALLVCQAICDGRFRLQPERGNAAGTERQQ